MSYNPSWFIASKIKERRKEITEKNCNLVVDLMRQYPTAFIKPVHDDYMKLLKTKTEKSFDAFPLYNFFERIMALKFTHMKNRNMPLTQLFHDAEYITLIARVSNYAQNGHWLCLPQNIVKTELNMDKLALAKEKKNNGYKYQIVVNIFIERASKSTFFGLNFFTEIHYDTNRNGMIFVPSKLVKLFDMNHNDRLLIGIYSANKETYDKDANYHQDANPNKEYVAVTKKDNEVIKYDW